MKMLDEKAAKLIGRLKLYEEQAINKTPAPKKKRLNNERITVWYTRFLRWVGRKRTGWKIAEALTKAVTKIELTKLEELATKRDLKEMDSSLQLKIEQTKSELQRWMVTVVLGTAILQTAIIAALILKLTAHI